MGTFFIYEFFFKELDILFPLSPFERQMLITIDVALSHLHLNS